jgi:hypothetical protein
VSSVSTVVTETPVMTAMRAAARERGLARLARDLQSNRLSLGNYFAGVARAGTAALLESRFLALPKSQPAESASGR